jgi:hypothetical protein
MAVLVSRFQYTTGFLLLVEGPMTPPGLAAPGLSLFPPAPGAPGFAASEITGHNMDQVWGRCSP